MSEEKRELAVRPAGLPELRYNKEEIELIKHHFAVGATDKELQLFLYISQKLGLNILTRQIHFVKRKRKNPITGEWEDTAAFQIGIDGYVQLAQDVRGPKGEVLLDGFKTEVLKDKDGKVTGAKATVYRKDFSHAVEVEVDFDEYAAKTRDGNLTQMWNDKPRIMIEKCALALALRRTFPQTFSGTYVPEEVEASYEPVAAEVPGEVEAPATAKPKPTPREVLQLIQREHGDIYFTFQQLRTEYAKTYGEDSMHLLQDAVERLTKEGYLFSPKEGVMQLVPSKLTAPAETSVTEPPPTAPSVHPMVKVKFTKELMVPIFCVDYKDRGPFKPGQVVELPKPNANHQVQQGNAEYVTEAPITVKPAEKKPEEEKREGQREELKRSSGEAIGIIARTAEGCHVSFSRLVPIPGDERYDTMKTFLKKKLEEEAAKDAAKTPPKKFSWTFLTEYDPQQDLEGYVGLEVKGEIGEQRWKLIRNSSRWALEKLLDRLK